MVGIAVIKIIPLQHTGNGAFGRQLNHIRKIHRAQPFAVETHRDLIAVNDF